MSWFVRATHLIVVLLVVTGAGLLAGAVRGQVAPVPSLREASLAPAPVGAVFALVPVLAVVWGWTGLPWSSLAAAGRRTSVLMLPMLVAAVSTFALCTMLGGGVGGVLEGLRNAGGLAGIALVGLWVFGDKGAVALPVGYLLAAYLLGRAPGASGPTLWAWVLADGGGASTLGLGCALGALGLVVAPRLPAAMVRRGGA